MGEVDGKRVFFAVTSDASGTAKPLEDDTAAVAFPFGTDGMPAEPMAKHGHGLAEEWAERGVLGRVLQGVALVLQDSSSSSGNLDEDIVPTWERGVHIYGALLCTLRIEARVEEGQSVASGVGNDAGDAGGAEQALDVFLPPWSDTERGAAVARLVLGAFTRFARRRIDSAAALAVEGTPDALTAPALLRVWRFLIDVIAPNATASTLRVAGHALAVDDETGSGLPWQHWVADGTALAELRMIVDAATLPDALAEKGRGLTHLGALLTLARSVMVRMHWPAFITAAAPPPASAPTPAQEQAARYGHRLSEQTLFTNLLELLLRASLATGLSSADGADELSAWESRIELQFWHFVGGDICNASCDANCMRPAWGSVDGCDAVQSSSMLSQLAWSHISTEAFEAAVDSALLMLRNRNRAAAAATSATTTSLAPPAVPTGVEHAQSWWEARVLQSLPPPAAPPLAAARLAGSSQALWGLLVLSTGWRRAASFSRAVTTASEGMLSDAVAKGAVLLRRLRDLMEELSAAVAAAAGRGAGAVTPGSAAAISPMALCLLGGGGAVSGSMSAELFGDAFASTVDAAGTAAAALHRLQSSPGDGPGDGSAPLSKATRCLADEVLAFANIDAVVLRSARTPPQQHVGGAATAPDTNPTTEGSGGGNASDVSRLSAMVLRAAEGVADGVTRGVRAASAPFDQLSVGNGDSRQARSSSWANAAAGALGRAAALASGRGGANTDDDGAATSLRATRLLATATLAAAGLRVGEVLCHRLAQPPPPQPPHCANGATSAGSTAWIPRNGHSVFNLRGDSDAVGAGTLAAVLGCCRSIASPQSMATAVEFVLDGACVELAERTPVWSVPSGTGEEGGGAIAEAVRGRWCDELCRALEMPQLGAGVFLRACSACSPPAVSGGAVALRAVVDSGTVAPEDVRGAVGWFAACFAHEGAGGVAMPSVLTLWLAGLQSRRCAVPGAAALQGASSSHRWVALLVDAVCAASAHTKGLRRLCATTTNPAVGVAAALAATAAREVEVRRLEAKVIFAAVHALALVCADAARAVSSAGDDTARAEEAVRLVTGELERLRTALAAMAGVGHGAQGVLLASAVDAALGMLGRQQQPPREPLFSARFRLVAQALALLLGALLQLMAQARGAVVMQAAAAKRAATQTGAASTAAGGALLTDVLPPPPQRPPSPHVSSLDVAPPPLVPSLSTPVNEAGGKGGSAAGPWQHLSLPQDILAGIEGLQGMRGDAGLEQAAHSASLFIALTAAHGTTSGCTSMGEARPSSVLALCAMQRFTADVLGPLFSGSDAWVMLSCVVV